jgi:hypothetical protein
MTHGSARNLERRQKGADPLAVWLCTDHLKRELDRLAPPLEGRMADIEWKPLPTGLWTPPAVFVEVENLLLQAFTDEARTNGTSRIYAQGNSTILSM